MYKLANKKDISDPHVVKISQRLDRKIIMLQKIIYGTQFVSKEKSHYHHEQS